MRPLRSALLMVTLTLSVCPAGDASHPLQAVNVAGRWEAEGPPAGPWTFDLVPQGNKVTGRVSQHGGIPGPVEITDGRIEGDTVTFKARNPVVSNVIKIVTYTGKITGDDMAVTRDIELVLNGPEATFSTEMGVFGQSGPTKLVAKRTGPVPIPGVAIDPSLPRSDVTGVWESLRWHLDVYKFDLQATGATLTGTVSSIGGPGREATSVRALPIIDGGVEGNTISFKFRTANNARTIAMIGKVQKDEIAFSRTVDIGSTPLGGDTLVGTFGPNGFVAQRVRTGAPQTAVHRQALEAKAKWAARPFRNYEFNISWHCACPYPSRPFSYRVEGTTGTVAIDAAVRTAMLGTPPQEIQPVLERYGTIDRLFDLLLETAARNPFSSKIEYDPQFGFPMSVEIHPAGISVADDFRFAISGFRPLQ